ncbi:hypothetical protein BJY16_005946 [Actinoplanes octamycinicus]|uniref:Uncharacterized protein n=1 Tax=Actinoplanes octamycinicus TaxID=135948 RepID=A0A7W7MA17_9ACTN|nr:hypothetical protein [Actinoplanes octamycinicus]MBB4742487.1 hypothetical protein [Actinoplanes octamycinicus]GIE60825.1 hypothetical protein Aoc01nite_62270 [Actinoplanes octamycinicus]
MWNNVLLADAHDPGERLAAARADIEAEHRSYMNGSPSAIRLTVRPVPDRARLDVALGSARRPAARTVQLSVTDIDRALERRLSPLALIACVLANPGALTARDDFPEIRESLRPDPAWPPPREAGSVITELRDGLAANPDVVLLGSRGTRKTRIAARTAVLFEQDGAATLWLDMRDQGAGAETVAWQLLTATEHHHLLVVVNQMQARIGPTDRIVKFLWRLRAEFELPILVLGTGQPEITGRLRDTFKSFAQVPARAEVPTDDEQARTALYWFACPRLFEIEPLETVVRRRFPGEVLDRLRLEGRIVRRGSSYYLAAAQDPVRLIGALRGVPGTPEPGEYIWEYLKLAGAGEGRAPLERLDLLGFPGSARRPAEREGSHYLAPAWDLLFQLGRSLDAHCDTDPTWGDNVGAAVFAAEALAELGHHRQWARVAGYIRDRWSYGRSPELPEPVQGQSREMTDFVEIQQSMAIEDSLIDGTFLRADRLQLVHPLGRTGGVAEMRGEAIDITRFHRTWMLGVLLGFEGSALDRSPERIEALVGSATQACDLDGSFYPRRVAWVTARVVLGLCQVGLNRENSEVVRRACDWLLLPQRDGGPYGEWWKGGTGSWNRDEATTAMCVTALIRAGVDPRTPQLREALAWLRSRTAEWTRTDREIDLALVLEAILLGAEDWRSAYGRVLNLLHWANAEFRRVRQDQPDPRFVPEGALRAPFAAAQLATLVRVAVGRESAALLDEPPVPEPEVPRQRAAADPVTRLHGAQPGVRPQPSLQQWRQAAGEIEAALNGLVQSRAAALRQDRRGQADAVRARLRHYRQRLEQCQSLSAQLSHWTPAFVLDGLKQLGDEVLGPGWDDELSYPGQAPAAERDRG